MGNSTKKSLFPNSIYNSNYDLNDNPSNDIIQTVGNRNATATASNCTFIDVNGAASLDVLQSITSMHRCTEIQEKSISIKNRCGDAPSNLRLAGNKRQANIISNGTNSQSYWSSNNGQRRRRLNNSEMTFESVQPMKTQCETLCEFVCVRIVHLVMLTHLIIQHTIASFKLSNTHRKQLYFQWKKKRNSVYIFFFVCHFSFAKPSQSA